MFKTKELCDAFGLKKVDRTVLLFFYEKIIHKKNHGMLGALSLLKLFDQKTNLKTKIEKKGIIQAARAVVLHDEDIWRRFSGREDGINPDGNESDDLEHKFSQKKVLKNLQFKDDPVSFLLIFCDMEVAQLKGHHTQIPTTEVIRTLTEVVTAYRLSLTVMWEL